jgi:xanthine dehydrogenase accessory factor
MPKRSTEPPTDISCGLTTNEFSELLRFLLDAAARNERAALVTLTDVIGSSPRAPGTHMAVTESGDRFGSVSSGCIEAAVVAEALRCIESGHAEVIRFGRGSRFIDIQLPCGGGMDLLFTPVAAQEVLEQALHRHEKRRALALALDREGSISLVGEGEIPTGWRGDVFFAAHPPRLKLCIFGRGAEVWSLLRLALVSGADVCVGSPDQSLVEAVCSAGANAHQLRTGTDDLGFSLDPATAAILLFHDHDWELDLLEQLLRSPAFFIGAMGSRRTHALRVEGLRARGAEDAAIDRIVGPVGLIPCMRDPQTLALSILAQVVAIYSARRLDDEALEPATSRTATLDAANI